MANNSEEIALRQEIENRLTSTLNELNDIKYAIDEHSIVAITDARGKITYVNDKFCELSKYSRSDILGKDHRIINSGHHSKEFMKDLWDTIQGAKVWKNEVKNKAKDGSYYWVDTTITPFLDQKGKPYQYVAIRTDITEHKEAMEKLNEAKIEAEQANQAKSEFLANMSHEIRTPLNAVLGFSQLLSSMITDKKQKGYLESILTAGEGLLTLINDILDLSKLEAGQMQVQYEVVNPHTIFNEMRMIFEARLMEKRLEFVIDVEKDLPSALILDGTRLRQVLLNLIGNAIKFTDEGSVKLKAKKTYRGKYPDSIDLVIMVEDTGIGVSEDQYQIIFESFRQQDGQYTRKYQGTGLGLTISKRLVEMMGGEILIKSTVGVGSEFEVHLNNIGVSKAKVHESKSLDTSNLSSVALEKAVILLVDDIQSNRDVIKEWLLKVQLDVIEAVDGEEALYLADKYSPDLIFMDIRMPVMDGYQAAKHLKENPETRDIPIIALTASIRLNKHRIKEYGFQGFLSKPVKINDLMGEMSRHIQYNTMKVRLKSTDQSVEEDSKEVIEEYSQYIKALEDQMIPFWKKLKGAIDMSDVKEFSMELRKLANHHNAHSLKAYAEDLYDLVQQFNVTAVEDLLQQFPDRFKLEKTKKMKSITSFHSV